MSIYKKISALLIIVCMQAYCMEEGNFHMLEGYRSLTDPEKQALRDETGRLVRFDPESCTRVRHPVLDRGNISKIVALAKRLNQEYPGAEIRSLGQTPAPIVETAKKLEQKEEKPTDRFGKIAFSGNWYFWQMDGSFRKNTQSDKTPGPKDTETYRQYLTSVGLSPTNDKEMVVVEYAQRGNGLLSFTQFLREWCADCSIRPNPNLTFLVLRNRDYLHVSSSEALCNPFSCAEIKLDRAQSRLLQSLADTDSFDDRLVPKYPFTRWLTRNPHDFQPSKNAKLCSFMITDYLLNERNSTFWNFFSYYLGY